MYVYRHTHRWYTNPKFKLEHGQCGWMMQLKWCCTRKFRSQWKGFKNADWFLFACRLMRPVWMFSSATVFWLSRWSFCDALQVMFTIAYLFHHFLNFAFSDTPSSSISANSWMEITFQAQSPVHIRPWWKMLHHKMENTLKSFFFRCHEAMRVNYY